MVKCRYSLTLLVMFCLSTTGFSRPRPVLEHLLCLGKNSAPGEVGSTSGQTPSELHSLKRQRTFSCQRRSGERLLMPLASNRWHIAVEYDVFDATTLATM